MMQAVMGNKESTFTRNAVLSVSSKPAVCTIRGVQKNQFSEHLLSRAVYIAEIEINRIRLTDAHSKTAERSRYSNRALTML